MENAFIRTDMLYGTEALNRLKNSKVIVFGVGGVGGYVVEGLVRTGVGNITVVDNDEISLSNLNRQIVATVDTIGKNKVEVIKERALSINPSVNITAINLFYLPQTADQIDLAKFDYVIDAIDTVTAKLEIIKRAKILNVPVISCMGTGGKTDATKLAVTDVYKTQNCPLSKVMRKELRALGIKQLKVVYSSEPTVAKKLESDEQSIKRLPPSAIFVPASAGLLIASQVVFDLIKGE